MTMVCLYHSSHQFLFNDLFAIAHQVLHSFVVSINVFLAEIDILHILRQVVVV